MTDPDGLDGCWVSRGGKPPPRDAFHVERVIDALQPERPEVIGMVRHAAHPFVVRLDRWDGELHTAQWAAIGQRYLHELGAACGLRPGRDGWLHREVWDRLVRTRPAPLSARGALLAWLPVTWDGLEVPERQAAGGPPLGPLGSYWVPRPGDAKRERRGWLVQLVGNVDTELQLQAGADLGLRIVMQVSGQEVRLRGLSIAGLASAHALGVVPPGLAVDDSAQFLEPLRGAIKRGLGASGVWMRNVELARGAPQASGHLTVSGVAVRPRRGAADPHDRRGPVLDFRVDVGPGSGGAGHQVLSIHRNDYIGSAAVDWVRRLFVRDPASQGSAGSVSRRRPTQSARHLDRWLEDVDLNLGDDGLLRSDEGSNGVEARGAGRPRRVTAFDTQPVAPKRTVLLEAGLQRSRPGAATPPDVPPLLSDEHGSRQTYVHGSELIARLQAYGMELPGHFRFARLPLVQRVRPSMIWAPDGELPNAEVRPLLFDPEAGEDKPDLARRLQLLVRYGSASPYHRHVLPGLKQGPWPGARFEKTARRKAQYLSVACDARWAWHEFGHVLAFAATGELEFPFAHSAGDALAAIVADPRSELAAEGVNAHARFRTFPWIEVPGRSHGRSAYRGYCWCGSRNRLRLKVDGVPERYHHSYFGEQLMSSSLFRLYRSLGGDTWPTDGESTDDPGQDLETRLAASDYCVYLIMRAIALLGPDSLAPAATPDQFVSALIEADLGTGNWEIEAGWPFDLPEPDVRRLSRRGGRVHKVIRWAFERQGLYATEKPREVIEGPGLAPRVDVYIADRRPDARDPGGYAPVPLRCPEDPSAPQGWHAHADAITRTGRSVEVRVAPRRRGEARVPVTVRAWWKTAAVESDWTAWPEAAVDAPGACAFRLPASLPDVWVLAAADCAADPANLGAAQTPPPLGPELMELVAHDNNLGLAYLPAR